MSSGWRKGCGRSEWSWWADGASMNSKSGKNYFEQIRLLSMIALFADDELMDHVVLKGGNVLSLLYKMANRTSMDIDASLTSDLPWSLKETERRLIEAFGRVFGAEGLEIFDVSFLQKPKTLGDKQDKRFIGYVFTFKVMESERAKAYQDRKVRKSIEAIVVGENQQRTFRVDFSTYEFIKGKSEFEIEGYVIQAYSLELIAVEKLRAICQQFPDYPGRKKKSSRSRDFFDIYTLVHGSYVDFTNEGTLSLVRPVFDAKEVSLDYLIRLDEVFDIHEASFQALKNTIPAGIEIHDFRFYFEFIKTIAFGIHTHLAQSNSAG